jgi:hypothetical protein
MQSFWVLIPIADYSFTEMTLLVMTKLFAQLPDIQTICITQGVPDTVVLDPAPGVATVRLLVQNVKTGKMGSVNLPYTEMVASASTTATPGATPAPAAQTEH